MEIILELDGYCIESAAKKKYDELVRELVKRDDKKLEAELQFLIDFLEKADFARLRSMGFDGREFVKVKIIKRGEKFIVERL